MAELHERLSHFQRENRFKGKGPLAVALVVTRQAKQLPFPLNPALMLAESKGQVAGLGKSTVQNILKDHQIDRELAKEGGRTSRGSVLNMERYVAFLNELHDASLLDFQEVERWWVARVKDFFAGKGFVLRFDSSKSLRYIIEELLAQALKRKKEDRGTTYAGTVLQHLIGAKLTLTLGADRLKIHGSSVSDASSGRNGDFIVEDVCIHVTITPTDAVMAKCRENLDSGFRPIVVTTSDGLAAALSSAKLAEIEQRVDVIEAGQFIAANIYEWSKFKAVDRKPTVERLVERYNEIIDKVETDPSLRISIGG